jgi:hypothetical protein
MRKSKFKFVLFVLLLFSFLNEARSQIIDTTQEIVVKTKKTSSSTSMSIPKTTPETRVLEVYRLMDTTVKSNVRNTAGIGDIIVVKVQGLKYLLDEAKCLNDTGE